MGKLSKFFLSTITFASVNCQDVPNFQVTSCNADDGTPELTFKIQEDYFENNISDDDNNFVLADGFYSRSIQQDELVLAFHATDDVITLSYTQATSSSGFSLSDTASISLAESSIEFQCRYSRTVNTNSQMTVGPFPTQPIIGEGDFDYTMDVQVGNLGGTTNVSINANHNFDGIVPKITNCRINSGEHELYAIHSFDDEVCFDNSRLNVVQTAFGKDIGFSLRTFRFTDGQSSTSDQDQTISCQLHLEPVADVPEEQAADCICHSADECSACGALFPFGRGSSGSKSIVDYLHSNHNYQTRITADGVVLYKIQDGEMNFAAARASCAQDSSAAAAGDAAVSGFLSLPMPRSDAENQIYYDLIRPGGQAGTAAFLDITEILPVTNPRSWVFRDGSPVTWFNWAPPHEPNGPTFEHNIEIGWATSVDYFEKWNDVPDIRDRKAVCVYFMPAGAQNSCPWLNDYED